MKAILQVGEPRLPHRKDFTWSSPEKVWDDPRAFQLPEANTHSVISSPRIAIARAQMKIIVMGLSRGKDASGSPRVGIGTGVRPLYPHPTLAGASRDAGERRYP